MANLIDLKKCTNAVIKITKLTDDVIEGCCENCNRIAIAKREHYSKKNWDLLQRDAKKHQNGEFK